MSATTELTTAVVIPAYNEGKTIRDLVKRVLNYTELVIVVDDGSSDDTLSQLDGLPIHIERNQSNQGKSASLWRGLCTAVKKQAEVVITLDGDGQHDPADIPALLEKAIEKPGCLIIAARLLNRDKAPKARLFANNFADFWVSWAAGQWVYDSQSGYRLYPARLVQNISVQHHKGRAFVFESEIIIEAARHGYPCTAVPVKSVYIKAGRSSHFRPVYDIMLIVKMVAWKLISRAMYPQGLVRALVSRQKN